jgi:hypothetical protein
LATGGRRVAHHNRAPPIKFKPAPRTPPYTIIPSTPGDNDRSTAQTVGVMQWIIEGSYRRPEVIAATREALRGCAISDPAWRKAQDIWAWVHEHIQFMTDEEILSTYFGLPEDLELLQRPELLLATGAGDCDCFTMLTAAMLKCAGVEPAIETIAADPDLPGKWSHVYALAIDGGQVIPMDTSHGKYFGWEAKNAYRRRKWAA